MTCTPDASVGLLRFGFFLWAATLVAAPAARAAAEAPIDRHALVSRHNPVNRTANVDAPMTVGNGRFAFGCDITGMQTFEADYHRNGIPVEIESRWCWVEDANPQGYTLADANRDFTLPDGRVMGFPTRSSTPAGDWLRKNPRIHPLGVLALDWKKDDGTAFTLADVAHPEQTLDLWNGIVTSRFQLGGVPVIVETACHGEQDTVAVRIRSELLKAGKLRVALKFPRGYDPAVKNTPGLDWSRAEEHDSRLHDGKVIMRRVGQSGGGSTARKSGDVQAHESDAGTVYFVEATQALVAGAPHVFYVEAANGAETLEFALRFSPAKTSAVATVEDVFKSSRQHWADYWQNSAAVDFTGSTHPLANKFEERIILSRYLMGAQMAGEVPPQESGLTCSTWYGKHHTEMIWWHAAHFALWGHDALLEKNLDWYRAQLPRARELAQSRGLRGARWAKMVGPVMRESPGGNPLIVWNQPHTIYLSELLYRSAPTEKTLAKYRDLVLETAEGMASMLHWDAAKKRYVLGPPLWIAQEIHDQATSQNPSFELAYWRWALSVAQQWRERLGLGRDAQWDHCIEHLPPLPQKDGKYVALESHPDTWDNLASRHDHPEMLMSLGFLPGGPDVDRDAMERTLDAVLTTWDWETKIWGWDYPMIAMTAARLGRAEAAVEILLRDGPNNRYLPTGHCPQRSDEALPKNAAPGARKREIAVYLPANGAFLSAAALMLAGWDGAADVAPGLPKDGQWKVRVEGLKRLP